MEAMFEREANTHTPLRVIHRGGFRDHVLVEVQIVLLLARQESLHLPDGVVEGPRGDGEGIGNRRRRAGNRALVELPNAAQEICSSVYEHHLSSEVTSEQGESEVSMRL
jgi:hypothetical protein